MSFLGNLIRPQVWGLMMDQKMYDMLERSRQQIDDCCSRGWQMWEREQVLCCRIWVNDQGQPQVINSFWRLILIVNITSHTLYSNYNIVRFGNGFCSLQFMSYSSIGCWKTYSSISCFLVILPCFLVPTGGKFYCSRYRGSLSSIGTWGWRLGGQWEGCS